MQLIQISEQTPTSEVDEEILEIFVEEVQEVLEEIITNFKAWKNDSNDTESLKSLRRSFHTLKGSGRLVGATAIGELGWRFENLLNRVVDGTMAKNDSILSLIEQVETVLPSMIEQFQQNESTPRHILVLISQADYLTQTKGESLGDFETETDESSAPEAATAVTDSLSPNISKPTIPEKSSHFEQKLAELAHPESTETKEAKFEEPTDDKVAESDLDLMPNMENAFDFSEDDFKLKEELRNLNLEGFSADEIETADFQSETEEWTTSDLESEDLSQPEFGTLGELPLETSLILDEDDSETIDPILFNIFKNEAIEHLNKLKEVLTEAESNLPEQLDQTVLRVFHTLNGSSLSVDFTAVSLIAAPMEKCARALIEQQTPITSEILSLFSEAAQLVENLLNESAIDEQQQKDLLTRVEKTLKSLPSSTPVTRSSETLSQEAPVEDGEIEGVPNDDFLVIFLEEADEILENTQALLERWQAAPNNMQLMKELQRELHTLKGGARMVGIAPMGDLSHHLESVLTRIVEGSAQSNPKLQEIVQNSVDELAAMLEAVRSHVPLEMPTDLIGQINNVLNVENEELDSAPVVQKPTTATTPKPMGVGEEEPKPSEESESKLDKMLEAKERDSEGEGTEDRIRVRVSLIDKLTNLAGELSISRAHMEQQQGAIKNNLTEMEQTVIRLRDQLRRLEIETEAQILSHFGGTQPDEEADDEFDPLELDRFSAMQQLSRSLMESVSDLMNIQDFLKNQTRQSEGLLIQQTRIGAELQENIMRTRMIPFARISPRLQRIARLTARELHKQVEFVINGENIEFERSVLNRMVPPLEHLLRNAIGHGIEDAPTRQQSGKNSVGKVIVDVSREGTELIIKLIDDGAGLNLPAIRKKAEERGLIKTNTVISDQDLIQFILEPAFSTATTITQISGRGVGMDVVNQEIKDLGGSLRIYSKTGEGTTFESRLPLSLTINQALMVHVGEETIAIPMSNVDAVMRAPRTEVLTETDEVRYYQYMDKSYRVFHLGELLGLGKTASVDTSLIPMLLVRSAQRRLALLVDGIEGSKEIVVKSVGPQIGAIRWIAGATILGDGRVVLILDIPTLTRVDTTTSQYTAPQPQEEVVVEEEKIAAKTIMVVDDSITVRKVTARLLKRQGMEVLTAKDGVDAIAQLQDHIPDLMLLDVEMPRMDGYELATQVRNNPDWKHVPIIMITSRTGAKHRDKAEKIGINRYLGKPFNETELLENINALLMEEQMAENLIH